MSDQAQPHDMPTLPPAPRLTSSEAETLAQPAPAAESATLPPGPAAPAAAPADTIRIPGYEMLATLGRGGMGVVYKARHARLGRVVALKMILTGAHAAGPDLARFRTEGEAIARLQHPNIVQIHEVGEHAGLPYFSLEFCAGGSLEKKLNGTPLPPKEAAALVEVLARAMALAHQKGVIHRDLKPANVLLAEDDAPKITDFGLAKKLDEAGQTVTGAVMGTPSYMAPEQAEGKAVGPLADLYALGAILYECLTGRPPFKAATVLDTVLQVVSDEPVPPAQLQSRTPRDLETICLKCLRKEPGKRYPDATALAEDLRRFRAGEPIAARPIGLPERGWRWCRRRPVVAGLGAALVLAVLLGGGGVLHQWSQAEEARNQAELDREAAERARGQAEAERALAEKARAEAVGEREAANKQRLLALDRELASRRNLYLAQMQLAQSAWQDANLVRLRELLELQRPARDREDLRGFEWHYFRRLCGDADRTFPCEDTKSVLAFSPDGARLAIANYNTVMEWHLPTGQRLRHWQAHRARVSALAYGPDGGALASAGSDGSICFWGAGKGPPTRTLPGDGKSVTGLAYRPGGKELLSAGPKGGVLVRDAQTGLVLRALPHAKAILGMVLSQDGRRLAVVDNAAGWSGNVEVWDLEKSKVLSHYRKATKPQICFSPDGKRLAGISFFDETLDQWDVGTGRALPVRIKHKDAEGVAFSADGRRVFSSGRDNTIHAWDASTGESLFVLRGHTREVGRLLLSPDGERLASVGADQKVRLWGTTGSTEAAALRGYWPQFTPDSRTVVHIATGGVVALSDSATGRTLRTMEKDKGFALSLALSPRGDQVAAGCQDRAVRVWDIASGKRLFTLTGHTIEPMALAYSPDGLRLVTAGAQLLQPGEILAWDMTKGRRCLALKAHRGSVLSLAFSPDSRRFVSLGEGIPTSTFQVWDVRTGEPLLSGPCRTLRYGAVAYSPDGSQLAVSDYAGAIDLRDSTSGKVVRSLKGHSNTVASLAFSPDGRRLASGSFDKTVKVWDTATGQEALTLRGHAAGVVHVRFSHDGRRLASNSSMDYTVKVWGGSSREEVRAPKE